MVGLISYRWYWWGLDAKLMVEWAFSGLEVEFWVKWQIPGSNVSWKLITVMLMIVKVVKAMMMIGIKGSKGNAR